LHKSDNLMAESIHKTLSYLKPVDKDFFKTLKERVDAYFIQNKIEKSGDWRMKLKTVAMLTMYFVPYFLIVTDHHYNIGVYFLLWVIMGFGMAGIGLSVMHDAIHGAYSSNKTLNKVVGEVINLIGGYSINWKIQHNVLHHAFTNVHGVDEDIDAGKLLRFSPHAERFSFHRFQHVYAWFLYGLMTLFWATGKDFTQLKRYYNMGLVKTKVLYRKKVALLILVKSLYYIYVIGIPLVFSSLPWYFTILGFLSMHFTAGLILSSIFQPAHVMETSDFPNPGKNGTIENTWAMNQLQNTCNFAPKSRLFSWYVGGLNFQIEHHLFPNICHIHYKKLSAIVQQVTAEFQLPYYVLPTFAKALVDHGVMLKKLGQTN